MQLPGQVDEDLYMLASHHVPIYLMRLSDNSWAILEGGISRDAEKVWQQIQQWVASPDHIHYWLISHKHYDHCGLLPYLCPRLTNVRVLVGKKTWNSWQKPKARQIIAELNGQLLYPRQPLPEAMDLNRLPVCFIDQGYTLSLGEKHRLKVLAASGHANDQLVFFDSHRQRLFAADAFGEFGDEDGLWHPLMFDDVSQYLATLARLQSLPLRQLIPGHGGIFCGALASNGAEDALHQSRQLIERAEPYLYDDQMKEQLANNLHQEWRAQSLTFVPAKLHLNSMRFMLNAIAQYQHDLKKENYVC